MSTFGERLRAAMDDRGPLCAGIDPHDRHLPGVTGADSALHT